MALHSGVRSPSWIHGNLLLLCCSSDYSGNLVSQKYNTATVSGNGKIARCGFHVKMIDNRFDNRTVVRTNLAFHIDRNDCPPVVTPDIPPFIVTFLLRTASVTGGIVRDSVRVSNRSMGTMNATSTSAFRK